ncbi:hypothetical protein TNCV_3486521 [Trichonephila clavipes]|nr:hypothetical protein TNCV_3486521 [Trichonephila clavipes]
MYLYNKVLLYTAVLRPILSYGCPIWGYAANTNIKILEIAQNSIIRCIQCGWSMMIDGVTSEVKRLSGGVTSSRRGAGAESENPL